MENRDRIMDMESILMVARWDVVWRMGEEVRGLRSTNICGYRIAMGM